MVILGVFGCGAFQNPPAAVANLKLTRYARQTGKKIVDLTAEEVEQFRI